MKPVLILLHGALGSKRYFDSLIPELQDKFDVRAINFEGHGGTESLNDFSIDLFTSNLIDYLEVENLKNVLVFGYSMGGYVALNVAKKRPELIAKIVTLGTKFNWSPEIAQKEIRMLNPMLIEEKVPKFAASLDKLHKPEDWKNIMNKTADLMLGLGNGNGLQDNDFSSINHPVVIGLGGDDKMVTREESERIVNLLPNGSFHLVQSIPHPIEMIKTAVLVDYINNYLS